MRRAHDYSNLGLGTETEKMLELDVASFRAGLGAPNEALEVILSHVEEPQTRKRVFFDQVQFAAVGYRDRKVRPVLISVESLEA